MNKAIIITTGEELLHGRTLDTNSAFICKELYETGIEIIECITVGDDIEAIIYAIEESFKRCNIIFITGGLGPTDDDRTVEAICRFFSLKDTVDENARIRIEGLFARANYKINKKDYKMALVPEGSVVFKNNKGHAPGFLIEKDDKFLIAMPGVPFEAEDMFVNEIKPYLCQRFNLKKSDGIIFRLTGLRESTINEIIEKSKIPQLGKWGISAKTGVYEVYLSLNDTTDDPRSIEEMLKDIFKEKLIDSSFSSPSEELVFLLKQKQTKLATAESCTGGLIAKMITDIPGSSEVYNGSIIAYSNEVKQNLLSVSETTLKKYGAVSEETALEMINGLQKVIQYDIAIAITGIAGPGGATKEKKVGTVCFAFDLCGQKKSETKIFNGDRERVRNLSALYAINTVREFIKK
jgi:nicotinamide-nucleotide amidase